jgi:colicin import membrane protein
MNWREPGSYFLPTLVAILIHVGAFALLIFEWRRDIQVMPEPLPPHMVANVIQEENKAVKDRDIKKKQQEAERLRQQRLAREKQAREKLAREKAAKEKLAKAKADKEKAVAEKKAKEKAAAEKLAKEKAAKAKAEKEKAAKEKAAKVKAEKEKAAKEKAAKEKAIAEEAAREAAEQSLMEQLALEEANSEIRRQEEAAAKAAQAERATQLTAEHQDIIRAQVAAAWRYPPNVTPEMEVEVRLTMVPTGEVISATVTKSSGHQALDRSVEQAIMKASPLSVPDDIRVFEKNFRTLTMKFRPENATW